MAKTVAKLNEEMRGRLFTVWYDHSTVRGHSHFLVLMSLLYDPLVYLTPEDYAAKNKVRSVYFGPVAW